MQTPDDHAVRAAGARVLGAFWQGGSALTGLFEQLWKRPASIFLRLLPGRCRHFWVCALEERERIQRLVRAEGYTKPAEEGDGHPPPLPTPHSMRPLAAECNRRLSITVPQVLRTEHVARIRA